MRRTVILAFVVVALALPVFAQRHSMSPGHIGGAGGMRSSHGGFAGHSGFNPGFAGHSGFSSRTGFGVGPGIGFRSGFGVRPGFGFRGGVSFGHNPRFFVNSRPFRSRRFSVYPYRFRNSYVYPYIAYPFYPLSYFDAYDYVSGPPSYDYPAYATPYQYAPGEGDYPDRGLAYQMREEGVGVYAKPTTPAPQTNAPAPRDRELPPVLLVYRDGRRTEVHNYAVVGQTLWIFSEDRAQKVPLTQLDLPATRKANEGRGIDFPPIPQ
jgi:hypothetical protein